MRATLHGRVVDSADYELLRQLERVAFQLTPADWREARAHRIALDAAHAALDTLRAVIGHAARHDSHSHHKKDGRA